MSHQKELEKRKYRNWVRGGLAYKYLTEGIKEFADDVVHEEHNRILQVANNISGRTCNQCCIRNLRPLHTCKNDHAGRNKCPWGQNNCNCLFTKKQRCPNKICDVILEEILKSHGSTPPTPNWKNTEIQKWCSAPWEIAKCFINAPGYSDKSTADDIDIPGLLHVFINNRSHMEHLTDKIDRNGILKKVLQRRNDIFHSPTMEMEDSKLNECIDDIITILEDEKELKARQDAQKAVCKLKELKQESFIITTHNEAEVCRDALASITKKSEELKQTIQDAKDDIDKKQTGATTAIDDKMQTALQSALEALANHTDIQTLKQAIDVLNKRVNDLELDNSAFRQEIKQRLVEIQNNIDKLEAARDQSRKMLKYVEEKQGLQKKLVELYQNHYVGTSFSPLELQENNIDIKEVYVPPKMVVEEKINGSNLSEKSPNKPNIRTLTGYRDMLHTNGQKHKQIYIVGDVGTGKSTFCKMMIQNWCSAVTEESPTSAYNGKPKDLSKTTISEKNVDRIDDKDEHPGSSEYANHVSFSDNVPVSDKYADPVSDKPISDRYVVPVIYSNVVLVSDKHSYHVSNKYNDPANKKSNVHISDMYDDSVSNKKGDLVSGKCDDSVSDKNGDLVSGKCDDSDSGKNGDLGSGKCDDSVSDKKGDLVTGKCDYSVSDKNGDLGSGKCDDSVSDKNGDLVSGKCDDSVNDKNEDLKSGKCDDSVSDSDKDDITVSYYDDHSVNDYDEGSVTSDDDDSVTDDDDGVMSSEFWSSPINNQNINELRNFNFLFFVPLQRMSELSDITEMIKAIVTAADLASHDVIDSILEQESERCLVLLDALDEWTPPRKICILPHVSYGLPGRDRAKQSTVITLSRPSARGILSMNSSEYDQKVELLGIKKRSVECFIEKYLSKFNKEGILGEFMTKIQTSELEHLEKTPLLLQQLVWLYCTGNKIGESVCDAYSHIINIMLGWLQNKEEEKDNVEDHVCHTSQDNDMELPGLLQTFPRCEANKRLLLPLARVAFEALTSEIGSGTFSRSYLQKKGVSKGCTSTLIKLGILVEENCFDPTKENTRLEFIHISYLEFFAAVHVSSQYNKDQCLKEQTNIFEDLFQNCKSATDILQLSNVVKMICGLSPYLISELSKMISDIVSEEERMRTHRKSVPDWWDSPNKELSQIQRLMFDCLCEGDSDDQPMISLCDVFIKYNTKKSFLQRIIPENVLYLQAWGMIDVEVWKWIVRLKRLQYLYIYKSTLQHSEMASLSSFIQEAPLRCLSLFDVDCIEFGCKGHTIDLSKHEKLQKLTVFNQVKISNINTKHLEILHLGPSNTLDIDLLLNASSLTELHFGPYFPRLLYNKQMDSVVHTLHQLRKLSLKRLYIDTNALTVTPEMRNLEHIELYEVIMSLEIWRTFVDSLLTLQQSLSVSMDGFVLGKIYHDKFDYRDFSRRDAMLKHRKNKHGEIINPYPQQQQGFGAYQQQKPQQQQQQSQQMKIPPHQDYLLRRCYKKVTEIRRTCFFNIHLL
ncbi:uncharacterized protein LOC123548605 [Mercenaria mercenaria]|uniref:uncharacterized protein LOC123548605 n=1 Tax=Mercenaria mercenaria TaxID=6596 RepID=UPI00234E9E4F|nr:uncharacterized protein LOC123548605 [Mercenaria mercenaria]